MNRPTRSGLALLLSVVLVVSLVPGGAVDAAAASSGAIPPATIDAALAESEGTVQVLVRLPEATVPSGLAREAAVARLKAHAERTQRPVVRFADRHDGVTVVKQFWLTNAVLVEVDTARLPVTTVASVRGVERLHPNYEITVLDGPGAQGGVHPAHHPGQSSTVGPATYGLERINAPEVWDQYGTRGAGVSVAVLDTGVDPTHPDVSLYRDDPSDPTYAGGWIEFDAAGNPVPGSRPADRNGHGTHVSGTVAGGAASGTHIGVAPDATLLHAKVVDDRGFGSFAVAIAGMEWAIERDVDVMSISLRYVGAIEDFVPVVRNAEAAGVVTIAGIGNEGPGTSGSPGNVYETFSVGMSDATDRIDGRSSGEVIRTDRRWGPDVRAAYGWPETYVVPDVAAPGVAVWSARTGGGHELRTGTSMATPHVAGSAVLVIAAAGRDLPPAEVRDALVASATKPPGLPTEPDPRYGAGIVDALAAVERVVHAGPTPSPAVEREPNDDFATASPLSAELSASATLDPADVDVFAADLPVDADFTVRYDRTSTVGTTAVALYGPDRELLTFEFVGTDGPVELSGTASVAGTHYVQVVSIHGSTGPYAVSLTTDDTAPPDGTDPNEPNDDPASATVLAPGETASGTVDSPSDLDYFAVRVDEDATFELRRPAGRGSGTLAVQVFTPDGEPVTEQLPLAVGGVRVVEAPARPAQYLLLLRSADGGTGAYSVTYDPAGLDDPEPPDEPVDVAWNEAVEDDLGADDPVDQFGYETDGRLTELTVARAPAGTGAFTLRVLDESGTRLVVLDPTLERLEDAPRVGPGERLTIRTVGETGGGTFTLVVAGDGDAAGAYTVDHAVPLVPTGDPTEPNNRRDESVLIRPGDDVAGRIEFADTTDWYVYQSNGRPERFALSRPAAGNDLISVQFVGRGITAPPLTDPFPVQPGGTQVVSVLPPSTGPWNAQVSGQLTGREGAYVLSYLAADDLIAIDPRFVPTTVSAGVENEITPAGAETVDDPGGTETIDHPGGAETVDGPKPSDGPVDAVEPPP